MGWEANLKSKDRDTRVKMAIERKEKEREKRELEEKAREAAMSPEERKKRSEAKVMVSGLLGLSALGYNTFRRWNALLKTKIWYVSFDA